MADSAALREATDDEIRQTLQFALQFRDGKRVHDADGFGAQLVAQRLVEHLKRSGYVLKKRPATPSHSDGKLKPGEKA